MGTAVFVGDDLARVNRAYWGTYGVAKAGLLGLMRILHDETEAGSVRVSGLQPGPMRSNIRSRAYVEEAASRVPSPLRSANACVHLLSVAGRAHRGGQHGRHQRDDGGEQEETGVAEAAGDDRRRDHRDECRAGHPYGLRRHPRFRRSG